MSMRYNKELVKPDGRMLRSGGPRDLQRKQMSSIDESLIIKELKSQINDLMSQLNSKGRFTGEEVDDEIRKAVKSAVDYTKKSYNEKISNFKKQVEELKKVNTELSNNVTSLNSREVGLLSEIKSIKSDNKVLLDKVDSKYRGIMDRLNSKIESLNKTIEAKDEIIKVLKNRDLEGAISGDDLAGLIKDQNEKIERLSEAVASGDDFVSDPDRPKMEEIIIDPLEKDAGKGLKSHITVKKSESDKKDDVQDKVKKLKGLLGKFPSRV